MLPGKENGKSYQDADNAAFLSAAKWPGFLQGLVMKSKTFIQVFWELYQDRICNIIAKTTIFFFKGIIVAAMFLANIKIVQHLELPNALVPYQQPYGVIMVFVWATLLFVAEALLIIIGILLFDEIRTIVTKVKRIQKEQNGS